MPKILFGDFETRSPVNLPKAGADVYARHPITRVMMFGYAFDDGDPKITIMGKRPPQAVIDHIGEGKTVVAHNAPFEWVIWNLVYRKEFPDLPELTTAQLICTMAIAYAMSLPGSLEKALAAAGVDMQKDMEGHRIMMKLSQPKERIEGGCTYCFGSGTHRFGFDCEYCSGSGEGYSFYEPDELPEQWARMGKYCGVDILGERSLYKRLVKLSPRELEVWRLDHKINQRGVGVDLLAVENAIDIVAIEKQVLDKQMREATDNVVGACSEVAKLTEWLKSKGAECDGIAKNDVADLLDDPILPTVCRRPLELRQLAAKSSLAKLPAILAGVCLDKRIRGLLQYHGAGTGRWAGRRIQLQNLTRPHLKQHQIEDAFKIFRSIGGRSNSF